jgi:hypothetical protein
MRPARAPMTHLAATATHLPQFSTAAACTRQPLATVVRTPCLSHPDSIATRSPVGWWPPPLSRTFFRFSRPLMYACRRMPLPQPRCWLAPWQHRIFSLDKTPPDRLSLQGSHPCSATHWPPLGCLPVPMHPAASRPPFCPVDRDTIKGDPRATCPGPHRSFPPPVSHRRISSIWLPSCLPCSATAAHRGQPTSPLLLLYVQDQGRHYHLRKLSDLPEPPPSHQSAAAPVPSRHQDHLLVSYLPAPPRSFLIVTTHSS